jgi:GDPmannose 4,6-dehydratase
MSHVRISFDIPEYTALSTGVSALIALECIRQVNPEIRYYQSSSSEQFGGAKGTEPQSEATPFNPRSPYATAKLYAYWCTVNYREAYGLHASNGIMFNSESERRLPTFVTRKVTYGIRQILLGVEDCIALGNLDAKRDWSYAKETVGAMWLILQQDKPDDYVIATGETHTVREFVELAFKMVGINIEWMYSGVDEIGYNPGNNKVLVRIDPRFYRPTEVDVLCGDASKIRTTLGWQPRTKFHDLVHIMMKHDCGEWLV